MGYATSNWRTYGYAEPRGGGGGGARAVGVCAPRTGRSRHHGDARAERSRVDRCYGHARSSEDAGVRGRRAAEVRFTQGYAEGRQADAVGLLPGRAQRDAYRRTDAFRRHWSTDRPGGTGPADRRRAGDRYPRQCPGDRRGRTEPARLEGREASAVPDAEHAERVDALTRARYDRGLHRTARRPT